MRLVRQMENLSLGGWSVFLHGCMNWRVVLVWCLRDDQTQLSVKEGFLVSKKIAPRPQAK